MENVGWGNGMAAYIMHKNKQTSPELKKVLFSWHRRFRLQKSIRWSFRGAATGLIFGLAVLGVSRLFPWEHIPAFVLLLAASFGVGGAFFGAVRAPSFAVVAHEVDGLLSLSERVGTAWEIQEEDSSVARLQRSDAIASINYYNPRDVVGLRPESFFIWMIVGALMGVLIMIFMPNPQTMVIAERTLIEHRIDSALEQLRRPQSDGESLFEGLDDSYSNSVQMILNEAEQSMRNIDSKSEALSILSESIRKIENIQREEVALDQIASGLSDALIQNKHNSSSAEGVPNHNEKSLDQLREHITAIDKEDSQRLLDNLYGLSNIGDSAELDALVTELEKSLESSDIDQVANKLELLLDDIETKQKRRPTEERIVEAINKIENAKMEITGMNRSIFTEGSVLGDGTVGNESALDMGDVLDVPSSFGEIPGNLPGAKNNVGEDVVSPKGDPFIIPNRSHEVNLIPSNNLPATPVFGEIFSSKAQPVKFVSESREYIERAQIPFHHQDLIRRYFYELANGNTEG